MPSEVQRQLDRLLPGAADVIPRDELAHKLERAAAEGRELRVKLGIDPSAPDIHLGHAVVLRKLRTFQDLGHTAVLIVGDFTGRIGDPSGRSETRPMLSPDELDANARSYFEQVGRVLDMERAEVTRNSEWLAPLTFADVARLASSVTVAQLLERDDFAARLREGIPISLQEFLYPLLQGYDSVAVRADVEMGGTDQTFNLLVGRALQRAHGMEPQVAFTMPLLAGVDGTRKMSKSYGNQVGLAEPPEEQFGKVMSIPDEVMAEWFRLCTGLGPDEVDAVERGLADGTLHPGEQKRRLAREIVRLYHGEEAAGEAEDRFDRVFRAHEIPDDVPEAAVPSEAVEGGRVYLPKVLVATGLASSNSEARRLLEQGGVRLDGEQITDPNAEVSAADLAGKVLQVGRRRFVRLAPPG
ncbi:MAG: tyrosine--tRNA ligase [Actinomycetota bacterium]|nr:tyrosine--tRNA ligase [Actinomycetota bacterium]